MLTGVEQKKWSFLRLHYCFSDNLMLLSHRRMIYIPSQSMRSWLSGDANLVKISQVVPELRHFEDSSLCKKQPFFHDITFYTTFRSQNFKTKILKSKLFNGLLLWVSDTLSELCTKDTPFWVISNSQLQRQLFLFVSSFNEN